MKTTFFLCVLFFFSLYANAQQHIIGAKAGLSSTNVSATIKYNPAADDRIGFSGGVTYEYAFKRPFSIGADILFSQRGFKNPLILTDNLGNPTGERADLHQRFDYVALPIKFGYRRGTRVFGFINAGVVPSVLVNAVIILPFHLNGQPGEERLDITKNASSMDLAAFGEIGGGYTVAGKYGLFASAAYQQSITTIRQGRTYPESIMMSRGLTLSLGVKYALGNNE